MMNEKHVALLLVDRCVTAAAIATVQNGLDLDDCVVEYYYTVSPETPESIVQGTIEAYEAQMEAQWIKKYNL